MTAHRHHVARIATVVLTLAAAGCASGSDEVGPTTSMTTQVDAPAASTDDDTDRSAVPTEAAGELDVCGLLAPEEVTTVLGEPATATDQSTGDLFGCSWEGEADALNVLSVSVYVHPDAATAKEMYDATMEGLGGSDIMGLGDEASYAEAFGLEVLSGRYDISVDNTGPTEEQSDLTIAQRIIDQLP